MIKINFNNAEKQQVIQLGQPFLLKHKKLTTQHLCFVALTKNDKAQIMSFDRYSKSNRLSRFADFELPYKETYTIEDVLEATEYADSYEITPCDIEINVTVLNS